MSPQIEHPYANTPYDILSDPDDPSVGIVSPDTPRQALRAQKPKVLKQGKREQRQILEADRKLANLPDRLACDVFLRSTLNRSSDLAELIEQHRDLSLPSIPTDWTEGLSFWIEPPVDMIQLQIIEITRSDAYDDLQANLLAVNFDS